IRSLVGPCWVRHASAVRVTPAVGMPADISISRTTCRNPPPSPGGASFVQIGGPCLVVGDQRVAQAQQLARMLQALQLALRTALVAQVVLNFPDQVDQLADR